MSFETIYGLSTLAGKSGVAVIRISGNNALQIAKKFCVIDNIKPNYVKFVKFKFPNSDKAIDKGLVLYFRAPNSFTGEDVIEFQVHGSLAIIKIFLEELGKLGDLCRLAEAGEFSKRAFLNDKIDLASAEGLANLIEAETSLQHELAIQQFIGKQSSLYDSWRRSLISMLAKLEALVDFPEDDIPDAVLAQTLSELNDLNGEIKNYLVNAIDGNIISHGIRVAIVGAPNVGKSTLLNALSRRDVAIVSDIAGTTRDVIEVKLDIGGYSYILYDTAGIRESDDIIEKEGINRSFKALENANLCILISDLSNIDNDTNREIESYVANNTSAMDVIKVFNKTDLEKDINLENKKSLLLISLKNDPYADQIVDYLKDYAREKFDFASSGFIANQRHKHHLEATVSALNSFSLELPLEISTEYVRIAATELGKIVGKINIEEILDSIFSSFCIGK
jgi:tRNA modification GTPase